MNPLISHEQLQDGVNNDARVDQAHTLSSCHMQHAGKAQKHSSGLPGLVVLPPQYFLCM